MLFKVHHNKSFKELNPEVAAIPMLDVLTDMQIKMVSLFSDYESPLRTLPEKKRRQKAAELAGYTFEKDGKRLNKDGRNAVDGKTEAIENGIATYRSIQYNEQYEMLAAINRQIQDTLDRSQEDREALCTVITEKVDKNGNKTIEKKIDAKLLYDLTIKANKLTADLPSQKKAKEELLSALRKDADIKLPGVQTSDDMADDDGSTISTLDKFMQTQIDATK